MGCGPPTPTLEGSLPSPATARAATLSALEAWRDGRPPGPIGTPEAPIQVVDTHRPAGRLPTRFEVLSNARLEGSRLVTAKVVLADPEETVLVRYHVFGVKPLWVVRLEDVEMLGHWEHPMPNEGEGRGAEGKGDDGGKP